MLSGVALYMGAWIETFLTILIRKRLKVALYMGAWIETEHLRLCCSAGRVALYMGAWIETCSSVDNHG